MLWLKSKLPHTNPLSWDYGNDRLLWQLRFISVGDILSSKVTSNKSLSSLLPLMLSWSITIYSSISYWNQNVVVTRWQHSSNSCNLPWLMRCYNQHNKSIASKLWCSIQCPILQESQRTETKCKSRICVVAVLNANTYIQNICKFSQAYNTHSVLNLTYCQELLYVNLPKLACPSHFSMHN